MRLKDAAKFFDKSVCRDAYGSYTFKAQLHPLQLYTVDGAKVVRRLLTTAPGVLVPQRHVVVIGGQTYLMGDSTADEWNGEPLRVNYVLHGATHLATVRTVAQALADAPGLTAWVSRDWSKDLVDARVSADNINQYSMFFSATENVTEGMILTLSDGRHYFVQGVHRALSGLIDAMSNEIPEPVFETIDFDDRLYDPLTDSYTATTTSVRILRLRWQEAFRYLTRASVEYERGDLLVMMLSVGTPAPKAGARLTLSDGDWTLVSHIDLGEHYSLHLRRV